MVEFRIKRELRLASALEECASMRDRHRRDSIVNDLPKEISALVERDETDFVDIKHIVSRCAMFPNGLLDLFSILSIYEHSGHAKSSGKSKSYERAFTLYTIHFLENTSHLDELLLIVANLETTPNDLRRLCAECVSKNDLLEFEIVSLDDALLYLSEFPVKSDGIHPVAHFVERLASLAPTEVAKKLHEWTDQNCNRLGMSLNASQRIRIKIAQPKVLPSYLLVEIAPDPNKSVETNYQLYQLSVWLWRQPDDSTCLYRDDAFRTITDIEKELGRLIDMAVDAYDLTVEVFLPFALMSLDIDQWLRPVEFGESEKLGRNYHVVVRSWDRMTPEARKLISYWRRRWQEFRSGLEAGDTQQIVHLCERRKYSSGELYEHLIKNARKACLGLPFDINDSMFGERLLPQVVRTGVPIALWVRECDVMRNNPELIQGTLHELLSRAQELPESIHRMRVQASDHAQLGNHLSLMWDDPERLPANYRLQTP